MNYRNTKKYLTHCSALILSIYCNATIHAATVPLNNLEQITKFQPNNLQGNVFDPSYQEQPNEFNSLYSPMRTLSEDYKNQDIDKAIHLLEGLKKNKNEDLKVNQMLVLSYLKAKKFTEARTIITDLLKTYPKKPSLYNQLALLEILQSDNKAAAITDFNKAIEYDANNIEAYVGLAQISASEKKFNETEGYLKKILAIDDSYIQAYIDLAILADNQGKSADVEKRLNNAHQKVAGNLDREIAVSVIQLQWYAKQKQFNKSLELAENLVSKFPNEKQPLALLAYAQVVNDKITLAEASLRKIITIDNADIQSRLKLTDLLMQQPDKQNEALKLLDEVESIKPDYQNIYLLKTAFFIKQKQYSQAQKVADKVRQLFPQSAMADRIQGDIYFYQHQFDQAIEAYLKVYKAQPSERWLFFMTNLLSQHGRQQEAIELLDNELKKTPDNVSLHYELATIYLNQRQYSQAKPHYLAVVDKKPDNVLALNNLAYLYGLEQSPEALIYAQKAYKLAPDTPVVLDTYGYLLLKQGNVKESLALLTHAVKLLPDNTEMQFHLAKAYFLNGDKTIATQLLAKTEKSSQDFPDKTEILNLVGQAH